MVDQIMRRDDPRVERPLKRRVGYEEDRGRTNEQSEEGSSSRPMIRRKVGYLDEKVNDTTKRMSDMEIDSAPSNSKGGDLD